MRKFYGKSVISALLIMALLAIGVTGCSKQEGDGQTSGSETTESGEAATSTATIAPFGTEPQKIDPEEVALTVGDVEVTAAELFYNYYSLKMTYEVYYGLTDWGQQIQAGYSYGDYLKQMTESQTLNLAYLVGKADEYGVALTDEEITEAKEEVTQAYAVISDEDKATYGFTEENLLKVNEHMKIANAVVEKMQAEAAENLTDEEKESCKYRKIQHILISTMQETESGESAESGENAAETETETESPEESEYKASQLELAKEVLEKAKSGEDFETLANEYTADNGVSYSINAAGQTPEGSTMVTEFAEAANALGEGEISDIVETQFGYHIIKCVSLEDEEAGASAQQNLAYNKISNAYSEWLKGAEYSFYDTWKNYVIINPEVVADSSSTQDSTGETAESETDTKESDSTADTVDNDTAESES